MEARRWHLRAAARAAFCGESVMTRQRRGTRRVSPGGIVLNPQSNPNMNVDLPQCSSGSSAQSAEREASCRGPDGGRVLYFILNEIILVNTIECFYINVSFQYD